MDRKILITKVDLETGEVISEREMIPNQKDWGKCLKKRTDFMLNHAKGIEDLDSDLLYRYCKSTKIINKYGQIQTFGNKLDDKIEDKLLEEGAICCYVLKTIKLAHPFSHFLRISQRNFISNWNELWDEIGCSDSKMRKRVKDFLVNNNLIKKARLINEDEEVLSRLVLNPYLYKNSSHAGQYACMVWQKSAIPSVNVNSYAYAWLQSMGYVK